MSLKWKLPSSTTESSKPRTVTGRQAEASPTERGFHLRLTADGANEPMFQFDDDVTKNRGIWSGLPGHTWGLIGDAKPGATVLAYAVDSKKTKTSEEQRQSAVIVRHQFGYRVSGDEALAR